MVDVRRMLRQHVLDYDSNFHSWVMKIIKFILILRSQQPQPIQSIFCNRFSLNLIIIEFT